MLSFTAQGYGLKVCRLWDTAGILLGFINSLLHMSLYECIKNQLVYLDNWSQLFRILFDILHDIGKILVGCDILCLMDICVNSECTHWCLNNVSIAHSLSQIVKKEKRGKSLRVFVSYIRLELERGVFSLNQQEIIISIIITHWTNSNLHLPKANTNWGKQKIFYHASKDFSTLEKRFVIF